MRHFFFGLVYMTVDKISCFVRIYLFCYSLLETTARSDEQVIAKIETIETDHSLKIFSRWKWTAMLNLSNRPLSHYYLP